MNKDKGFGLYNDKVIDHFTNPHNYGEISDASGVGKLGNPTCGDLIQLQIKVKINEDGNEIIEDIKFKTFGCAAAIATSSVITDMAIGMTLEEAKKLTRADVSRELGGLPPIKEHCSNLSSDALRKAIEDYEKKKK
jgi:nitrogen fixation protein NifU and related proteins